MSADISGEEIEWPRTSGFLPLLHQCSCLKWFYYVSVISNLTFSSAVYNYSTFTLVTVFFFNFLLKFNSYNSICHFKVYTSVAFSTFTELCGYYFCLVLKYFFTPKGNLMSIKQHVPRLLPPTLGNPCLLSLWIYLFWIFHGNGVIKYVVICIWFLSLTIIFYGFIHGMAYMRTSFLSCH